MPMSLKGKAVYTALWHTLLSVSSKSLMGHQHTALGLYALAALSLQGAPRRYRITPGPTPTAPPSVCATVCGVVSALAFVR